MLIILLLVYIAILSTHYIHYFLDPLPFEENLEHFPKVAILVPIAYVPFNVFNQMIDAIKKIEYPNYQTFVIAKIKDEDKKSYTTLCESHVINLQIQAHNEKGFKARALNLVLERIKGTDFEFGIIVDGYHKVKPQIVKTFMQYFVKQQEKVAYLQAGVDYQGSSVMQVFGRTLRSHIYYFYILARSRFGNAQFNGSTSCFRLSVLYDLGGFPEYSYTENSATSIEIQLNGYHAKFINQALSSCSARSNLSSTVSQLYRWGHGLGIVVKKQTKRIMKSPHLSKWQKLDILWYHAASSPASSLTIIIPVILSIRLVLGLFISGLARYNQYEQIHLLIIFIAYLTFFWVGAFTIFAEDSIYSKKKRFRQLFIFSLLSLSFSIFIISAYRDGYRNKNGPFSVNANWKFILNATKPKLVIRSILILELLGIYLAFSINLVLFIPILLAYTLGHLIILMQ